MKKRSKKGFTLIELIIVIAILAILALIAIPAYNQYRTNAKIAANEATAKIVYDAHLVSDATKSDAGAAWRDFVDNTAEPPAAEVAITGTPAGGDLKVVVSTGGAAYAGTYPKVTPTT